MAKLSSCAALVVTSLSSGFLSLKKEEAAPPEILAHWFCFLSGRSRNFLRDVLFFYNWIVFFTLQGVESERCASFQAAMDAGHPVKIEANQSLTLADGEISLSLWIDVDSMNVYLSDPLVQCQRREFIRFSNWLLYGPGETQNSYFITFYKKDTRNHGRLLCMLGRRVANITFQMKKSLFRPRYSSSRLGRDFRSLPCKR